jgi:AraC-like DNA-binding protein
MRFTGIALLMLLIVIVIRDQKLRHSNVYLVLTCISVTALFLGYAPANSRLPDFLHYAFRLMDVPHLVFTWLFALSLYQRNFKIAVPHIIVGTLYVLPIYYIRLSAMNIMPAYPVWLITIVSIMSLALTGHLIYVIMRERGDDLVEKRRLSRLYFVIIIIFVTIVAAVSEIFGSSLTVDKTTVKIASIWPAIVWGCYWMLKFNDQAIRFKATAENTINQRDRELKHKLDDIIKTQQAFKEADLTIIMLSKRIGVTQHRLRAFINQTLGYDNFSAYLNEYRIEAVKKALELPENVKTPIITIALDNGFRSLSPFNRAFRLMEDTTPSEYRLRTSVATAGLKTTAR